MNIVDLSKISYDVYRTLRRSALVNECDPIPMSAALETLGLTNNKSNKLAVRRAFRQAGFEYVRLHSPSKRSEYAFLKNEEVRVAKELMRPLRKKEGELKYVDTLFEGVRFDRDGRMK